MKSTTRFTKNKKGIECLNCKQPISDNDNFCSNCGQVNDELPLSIKQFISEFFSGFFSFDTRFFNTFIPLLFKPGRISKDYIEGKRRRYVNPFQLYLHVTIVFFLLQGLFSVLDGYKIAASNEKPINDPINDLESGWMMASNEGDSIAIFNKQKIERHIDSILSSKAFLMQLNNNSLNIKDKDSVFNLIYNPILSFISNLSKQDSLSEWRQKEQFLELKYNAIAYLKSTLKTEKINYPLPKETEFSVEKELLKNMTGQTVFKKINIFIKYNDKHPKTPTIEALDDLGQEKTKWNIFYFNKAQDFNKFVSDSRFRKSYYDRIVSKISIALFFMLPIFTWFISLLYIRGKKNYTEHLVFVFNVQTVFFILLIFYTIFNKIFKTDTGIMVFLLVFLFYLYKSLRNYYKQKRFKTIVKFLLLNFVFIKLAVIGGLFISFLTFAL